MVPSSQATASLSHVSFAWDVLCHALRGAEAALHAPSARFDDIPSSLFITWTKASRLDGDYRLRGCIGTLEPRPLHSAVRDYTLTSALRDRRFNPIQAKELPYLRCTVSLLSCFEQAATWSDWEIGVHGLIIEFVEPHSSQRRTATFLPEVASHEGWDKQQTIDQLIRKAGFTSTAVTVRSSLRVTRYQSTTCSLTYDEYCKLKDREHAGSKVLLHKQQLVTVSAAQ